ncbi:conserved hypothetical protein [Nitrospina gracilis 3/211]|uniref:Uncharacterized protein n=1 Tax=Nitrospina gracilis (strain 3/211) TaxID=1266370 RepID=M1Z074_NITG3|nr:MULTISPECIES: hypothetical protein [Nitrospina]MCF8721222.1 hypothetical protein [Nitrospina gracilis Nb-211]MCF8723813.1 hypothetical protein [Nitrospina sp. Nb-3]CCQ90920.1 conserved hypothetical protein [Nitrospina gracilis 3/211]
MNPFLYYLGRSLQIVGLAIITYVVFKFFQPVGMEFLLYYSIAGVAMFYGGTLLLEKNQ